ncbi:DUF6657 family protein [Pelotomaculum propionicicum]|uniref:DUF6657 family protein n=1 Tax=Pelotomaculum propionicicum TaxID=258475 RepID=UPI003B81B7DD
MDRIKSAYEMAMERFQQRKEVPPEEIEKMEHIPVGKAMAARYLNEKDFDFLSEMNKYPDKIKGYMAEGALETFLSNIQLPVDRAAFDTTKKALEGITLLKVNKDALREVYGQIEHLFNYYEKTLEQAFGQFKERFSAKMASSMQSIEKKMGAKIKVDPEKQPGFREEWSRVVNSFNAQYNQVLAEQKEKLKKVR